MSDEYFVCLYEREMLDEKKGIDQLRHGTCLYIRSEANRIVPDFASMFHPRRTLEGIDHTTYLSLQPASTALLLPSPSSVLISIVHNFRIYLWTCGSVCMSSVVGPGSIS